MPIFSTNWMRSVTSTPHSPDSTEMEAVSSMMPNTTSRAATFGSWMPERREGQPGKITVRIFTMARLTQPRMMQLMGRPRYSARKPRRKAAGGPL